MNLDEPYLKPTDEDLNTIKVYMENRIQELNQMLKAASEVVSRITHYTTIGIAENIKKHAVKTLQLISIDERKLLVVVVLDNDIIKNYMVRLAERLTNDEISRISIICSNVLTGNRAEDITLDKINEIVELSGIERDKILPILDGILDCIKQCDSAEIYTDGTANLLEHPEFNDVAKAKSLIELFNNEEEMAKLLNNCENAGAQGIVVKIGTENELSEVSNCSVITATYSFNGVNLGTIGVIGPTRMDYNKVISALEYIRKKMLPE